MVSRYVIGTKTEKAAGIWEHWAKMEGNKGTRATPLSQSIEPASSYPLQ